MLQIIGTMATSNACRSNSATSAALRIISLSNFVVLISLLPLVAGIQSATKKCAPIGTTETTIDLSYLHRCGEGEIATAIQGRLEEEQNHQTTESDKETVLDIDLTASLIGKNISEILSSLKRSEETPKDEDGKDESSVLVKLTARRNRLSAEKVTAVLDFVLENGPSNTTEAISSSGSDEDDDSLTSEETTSQVSEEALSDNNETITDDSKITDDAPKENSETNTNQSQDETTAPGSEEIEPTEETSGTTKLPRMRPAFVSIQSLDLGWNNLGTSSGNRSSVRVNRLVLRNHHPHFHQ